MQSDARAQDHAILTGLVFGGASVTAGLWPLSIEHVAYAACAAGVLLNLYLLVLAALGRGASSLLIAIIGSVPAGLFDALKIFAFAFAIQWLSDPPPAWFHIVLLGPCFLVALNGRLHGAKKTQIDAGLSVLWLAIIAAAFATTSWQRALLTFPLSIVYVVALGPLAAGVASRLLYGGLRPA